MKLANIRLIAVREIRDHLRDRRTLAMMIVLPLVLYPVLALTVYQLAQFLEEKPCRVLVAGTEQWTTAEGIPPLLDEQNPRFFHPALFTDPRRQRLLEVVLPAEVGIATSGPEEAVRQELEQVVATARVDVAVWFPPDFRQFVQEFLATSGGSQERSGILTGPRILYSTASDRSQVAYGRVQAVLDRWRDLWRRHALAVRGIPQEVLEPFGVVAADVAVVRGRQGAALWARVLPILLIIWAATGAFYPAIDACAGEKERGTLETLLVSPAERTEIVVGKLIAVSLFSTVTALTNVLSMMLAGWLFLERLPQFGAPPLVLSLWLIPAVIPVAILFAGVSIALAAQARSTREAQYYLMPVILVTMPLVLLPTTPGVDISLGTSLLPVTGLVLVLKALLAGQLGENWVYTIPAVGMTLALCVVAVRVAIRQFESEKVLFREAEILSAKALLRNLAELRRRPAGPLLGVVAGLAILAIKLAWSVRAEMPGDFDGFVRLQLRAQLVTFALPAVLGAILLSHRPRELLGFRRTSAKQLTAAIVLALLLQPLGVLLQRLLLNLFPPGEVTGSFLQRLDSLVAEGSLFVVLVAFAITPAVCEELAFRGLVLGCFFGTGRQFLGVVASAIFFAAAHLFLVQQISAGLLGIILGGIVVFTGSLWPAIVFHAVYNGGILWAVRIGVGSPIEWLLQPIGKYIPGVGNPWVMAALWAVLAVSAVAVWGWGFGWKPAGIRSSTAGQ